MIKQAVYHSDDSHWYKMGDEPWRVRIVSKGETIQPLFRVAADDYFAAFEKLYGHPVVIPSIVRAARREVLA